MRATLIKIKRIIATGRDSYSNPFTRIICEGIANDKPVEIILGKEATLSFITYKGRRLSNGDYLNDVVEVFERKNILYARNMPEWRQAVKEKYNIDFK